MKQITVDSSLNKLSTEALTVQIGRAESPLASFLLVLSFYGESLGGRGFITVLPTIAFQAPLDRARGELSSDTRTLISCREILRGKIGEIWRSEIATFGPGYEALHVRGWAGLLRMMCRGRCGGWGEG
jgi:hypothetical protein